MHRACLQAGLASNIYDQWKDQVWEFRHPHSHGESRAADMTMFRAALDSMLALVFGLRPAAMLELASVSVH
jgi:hypothetical protein